MRSLTWYILSFYFCGWWKLCLEYRYDFLFSLSEVNIGITVTSSCNRWQVLKNKNTSFFNIIVNKCVRKKEDMKYGPHTLINLTSLADRKIRSMLWSVRLYNESWNWKSNFRERLFRKLNGFPWLYADVAWKYFYFYQIATKNNLSC